MKKVIATLMITASLAACGGSNYEPESDQSKLEVGWDELDATEQAEICVSLWFFSDDTDLLIEAFMTEPDAMSRDQAYLTLEFLTEECD